MLPTQQLVDQHTATYPKALGVAWDSRADTMYTSINLPNSYISTKRGIVSDIARTFDVLGWISPVILPMKILYRDLWQAKLDWDDEVDPEHKQRHRKWREELHILADVRLPRHYFNHRKPATIWFFRCLKRSIWGSGVHQSYLPYWATFCRTSDLQKQSDTPGSKIHTTARIVWGQPTGQTDDYH